MKKPLVLLFAGAILLTLFSCGKVPDKSVAKKQEVDPGSEELGKMEGLVVENSWVRNSSKGTNTALFFDIINTSDNADQLLSVESDAAEVVEIHETYSKGKDMMGMRQVANVEIPANSTFNFKPMAHHVMLIKLVKDLKEGELVKVRLKFKTYSDIVINAPVKKMKM